MNIILNSLLYVIVILFPYLLNFLFILYKKNISQKESKASLNIAILLSGYFGLYLLNILDNNLFIIFSTIPIFFSIIYKKDFIILIELIIFFEKMYNLFDLNLILFSLFYISYIFLYIYYLYRGLTKKVLFLLLELFSILYFLIEFKSLEHINLIIIVYSIFSYLSFFTLSKSKEIIKIFSTFKDVERESVIKLSLFKITHEIKNPLAVVKGYLDMFNINNEEKCIKYIGIIKNEIARTLNLLNDLNEFNKIKLNKEIINFSTLIDEIKDIFVSYSFENKIKCIFRYENNIIINADFNRLKQVLINIIKNAIEASNPNDVIVCTSYVNHEKLIIIVKDNGSGMSQETIDNLFVPFYTTKDMGTGLGLCLSKEIIEVHNGTINYTSSFGNGTTVKIMLPI